MDKKQEDDIKKILKRTNFKFSENTTIEDLDLSIDAEAGDYELCADLRYEEQKFTKCENIKILKHSETGFSKMMKGIITTGSTPAEIGVYLVFLAMLAIFMAFIITKIMNRKSHESGGKSYPSDAEDKILTEYEESKEKEVTSFIKIKKSGPEFVRLKEAKKKSEPEKEESLQKELSEHLGMDEKTERKETDEVKFEEKKTAAKNLKMKNRKETKQENPSEDEKDETKPKNKILGLKSKVIKKKKAKSSSKSKVVNKTAKIDFRKEPDNSSQYFYLSNGVVFKSLYDLKSYLSVMPKEVFSNHVSQEKNDFANWVEGVFSLKNVAAEMKKCTTMKQLKNLLKKYE